MATAAKVTVLPAIQPGVEQMLEQHYSCYDLAVLWGFSEETIWRMFGREPGVVIWQNPVRSSSRRCRTARIPESVAKRVYRRMQNKGLDR
jgi:hypothetical protein